MSGKRICGAFIAWRKVSPRTRDLAKELNLDLIFLKGFPPYIHESLKLLNKLLSSTQYDAIFVQVPQGLLLSETSFLKRFKSYVLVADVHTGFILPDSFKLRTLNVPFKAALRRANIIILHNHDIKCLLDEASQERVVIVYDPPIRNYEWKGGGSYAVIPSSGHRDEPIAPIIKAVAKAKVFDALLITGSHRPTTYYINGVKITYTGYVKDDIYWDLLRHALLVIALTRREFTFLRAAWEALCIGAPFILSYTRTLRRMYRELPEWAFMKSYDIHSLIKILQRTSQKYDELLSDVRTVRKELTAEAKWQLEELKDAVIRAVLR